MSDSLLRAGLVVLFVVGACASADEGASGGPGGAVHVAGDQAAPGRVDLVRGSIESSLAAASNDLAAIEAAQVSVEETIAHLLDLVERLPPGDERDEVSALVDEVVLRSATLAERVQVAAGRIDAFESGARATFEAAPSSDVDDPGTQDALDALSGEGEELSDLLAPLARGSDGLVRDVTRLSARVEGLASVRGATAPGLAAATSPAVVAATAGMPDRPQPGDLVAELHTSKGVLVLELYPELAPRHVENFQELIRSGFYDGTKFHRIVPGFVIQGGCPEGTGAGGPGWELKNEFSDQPHVRGTLSMARMAHPDSAGSQFFICLDEWRELDGKYTVFGHLIRGDDTLAEIEKVGTVSGVPVEPVIIESIELRERRPDDRDEPS